MRVGGVEEMSSCHATRNMTFDEGRFRVWVLRKFKQGINVVNGVKPFWVK